MALWQASARERYSAYSHPWLATLLFAFDRRLQRQHDVLEYSSHRSCIFRVEFCLLPRDLALRDGTRLYAGQRIARLHFWNEHVPSLQRFATAIAWGIELHRRLNLSLTELAAFLASRSELDDVVAVCADVTSAVREQSGQIARIMARYGFETIGEFVPAALGERLHRLGENILISLLVFAQNAGALRSDTLRRVRVPIYLSRHGLERKFGRARHPSPKQAAAS
jgi:YkoP domain